MVTSALHQAGIAASPELAEAVATSAQNFAPLQLAPNFAAVLDDLAKECRGDPFAVASMIAETGHVMPADGCALIAVEQVRSANPVIREAAALLLLDPEPEVRGAVAAELQARVSGLSPVALLRYRGFELARVRGRKIADASSVVKGSVLPNWRANRGRCAVGLC